MGGDHAPGEVIYGALAAVDDEPDLEVLVCGDEERLHAALLPSAPRGGFGQERALPLPPRLKIVHAAHAIAMDEAPVRAVRQKPGSSIQRALDLVRTGEADAFFSAGNTGAVCAAASLALRRVAGVRRPAIAVMLPTAGTVTTLIDAGANLQPKPIDLVQYAIMGAIYQREILGVPDPAVGILSMGAEATKGGALLREAAALCAEAPALRFLGFVEGHELFRGAIDVVVCDARTGNAVLKVVEGVGETLLEELQAILERTFHSDADRRKLSWAIKDLTQHMDYAEYGGAPLLGVDGVVILGHGRSEARAVCNGIKVAARAASSGLKERIAEGLRQTPRSA
jgi:glycerol-3-phosphate acyltransferase PlsX